MELKIHFERGELLNLIDTAEIKRAFYWETFAASLQLILGDISSVFDLIIRMLSACSF